MIQGVVFHFFLLLLCCLLFVFLVGETVTLLSAKASVQEVARI